MNQLNYDAFKKLFKVDALVIMYMIISMALRYSLMIRSGSTPPSWSIATESRKFLIFLLILEPWCLNATLSHTLSMVYPNNIFMLNPPFDTPHIFQPFFKWDQFSHLRNVTYQRLVTVSFKLHTKKVSPPPNFLQTEHQNCPSNNHGSNFGGRGGLWNHRGCDRGLLKWKRCQSTRTWWRLLF